MMSVPATCRDCGRQRKPGEIFCECGAFLDYSVPTGDGQRDGEPNGATVDATAASESEWPPGPYEPTSEPVPTSKISMRLVHCRNEECKALNPETLVFCWKCGTPMAHGEEAQPPWSLRRFLRLEKQPLPAGEREYPTKPFFSKDPRSLLRLGLIVAAVLVLGAALVIGAIKALGPAWEQASRGYGASRMALFPRFEPVHPSSVNPPVTAKSVNRRHPPRDAFDRNLSTYWQSTTARHVPDLIRVTFKPPAHHIEEVVIFAGDPTATTIVPASIQMTFYRWEQNPSKHDKECERPRHRTYFPERLVEPGSVCVKEIVKPFKLENTPTGQRFNTGRQENVSLVVVTIVGVHRSDNPNAKAAITDIEYFDKD
jgi:hypothetical protein